MTRKELVLSKLQELSDEEVLDALNQLTQHVRARLRFGSFFDRTKSGAHSLRFLGEEAVGFYVEESLLRLYDPERWDWKFETLSFVEQLIRIANKLISDKVQEYRDKKDKLPKFDNKDVGDIYDLNVIAAPNIQGNEDVYSALISATYEVSKDNDTLHYFTILYFEGAKYPDIAEEMGISVTQVYVLKKKLVRRLMSIKTEFTAYKTRIHE